MGENTQADDNGDTISPPGTSKEKYGNLEDDEVLEADEAFDSGKVSVNSKIRRPPILSEEREHANDTLESDFKSIAKAND